MSTAERHPVVADYERYVNPAFVKLLGTFGYGRVFVRAKGTSIWDDQGRQYLCLLYTSPSPRDRQKSRMPSSA